MYMCIYNLHISHSFSVHLICDNDIYDHILVLHIDNRVVISKQNSCKTGCQQVSSNQIQKCKNEDYSIQKNFGFLSKYHHFATLFRDFHPS